MRRRTVLSAALLALSLLGSVAAQGAEWPQRPVTIVVPDPPGGGLDTLTRLLAEGVSQQLGQPVVVENKPGASAMIGTQAVARAPADGHTLLLSVNALVMNPLLHPTQAKYQPFEDFTPVAIAAQAPLVLAVNDQVPATSLDALIDHARAHPSQLFYGSIGNGSPTHIYGELLSALGQADFTHVPYQGGGPLVQALLGNQVQMSFLTWGSVRPHVDTGRMRVLAITGESRLEGRPEIPTFIESGYPDFRYSGWLGLFVPSGTPPERVARLTQAVQTTLQDPALQARIVGLGMVPDGAGPEALTAAMHRDEARWRDWIPRFGVQVQ